MPRKPTKHKSKNTAPIAALPVTQKPPNSKLVLRVPPFLHAKAPSHQLEVPPGPEPSPSISPRTPETAPEAASGSLQQDEDFHVDLDTEIPYIASPRQNIIDHYWETQSNVTNTHKSNQKDDLHNDSKAASHPENVNGKRKASTHSLERGSSASLTRNLSINPGGSHAGNNSDSDHDPDNSDVSIQPPMSKKARKTPREPIEVEETDDLHEELDMVVTTKGQQARKPSTGKKDLEHARLRVRDSDSDDEEEGSYKKST